MINLGRATFIFLKSTLANVDFNSLMNLTRWVFMYVCKWGTFLRHEPSFSRWMIMVTKKNKQFGLKHLVELCQFSRLDDLALRWFQTLNKTTPHVIPSPHYTLDGLGLAIYEKGLNHMKYWCKKSNIWCSTIPEIAAPKKSWMMVMVGALIPSSCHQRDHRHVHVQQGHSCFIFEWQVNLWLLQRNRLRVHICLHVPNDLTLLVSWIKCHTSFSMKDL